MKERQVIFQAWLWRLNDVPVEEIAKQGFTAIQTSPLQPIKEKIHDNLDNAWAIYQPIGYDIGNDLGTEEDLRNLADKCHTNGLKLIVDIVMHHVANERGNDISHLVKDEYKHFYEDSFMNINNYNDEYELTHRSLDGLPALDLENKTVVNAQFNYLKQLKNAGVDGVRIDAFKHLVKSYRVKLAEELKNLGMYEYSYGEVIYADTNLQSNYNEIPLYVNQSLNNGSQYGAIVSHDDFPNSDNPYLRRDPNYFYAEYGYFMDNLLKQNVVYFCRPDDYIWKTDNIRYINARR